VGKNIDRSQFYGFIGSASVLMVYNLPLIYQPLNACLV